MKILMCSDIHYSPTILKKLKYKEADMLIVSGDLGNWGTTIEITDVLEEINKLKIKHKIVVFGNHDISAQNEHEIYREIYPDIQFLLNEIIEIEGLKIYGTPYVRAFGAWAFHYHSIRERIELTVPREKVDIIVAHEPPSHGDLSFTWRNEKYDSWGEDIGNVSLLNYINNTNSVKLVVCGHVHECGGKYAKINNADVYNVAGKVKTIVFNSSNDRNREEE